MGSGRPPRAPPAARVLERVRSRLPPELAARWPSGYQRLGRVLLLRLPHDYRPFLRAIGDAWLRELPVATVLVVTGPVAGELRQPRVVRAAGLVTETEVVEHGIRWRLDAARILFAQGNRAERARAGRLVRPGETVVDLFAGIGYFAIPAARAGAGRVVAVEKNPLAVRYLRENLVLNRVADRVEVVEGDNRTVRLPEGVADRVFLGYLPSAVPWVPRAVRMLRPTGGWLHVHTVADARRAAEEAVDRVTRAATAAGAKLLDAPGACAVKPYGPGRTHVVVDAHAVPAG